LAELQEMKLQRVTDPNIVNEVARQLKICNACRYCEGYCAVWPAMERRRVFQEKDVIFLANLCHNCSDCYTACPFTPPHEFGINIPKAMSEARLESYQKQSTPKATSRLFKKPGRTTELFALTSLGLLFLISTLIGKPSRLVTPQIGLGSFYVIIPYWILISAGLTAGGYVLIAYFLDFRAFCVKIHNGGSFSDFFKPKIAWDAAVDVLNHTYFRGGGTGCSYPKERGSHTFLILHMMIFYGFILAIISTINAAVYQDVLKILPPYEFLTLPVIFGVLGGTLIVVGSTVLLYYKKVSSKELTLEKMRNIDTAFLVILELVSVTGFLTMVLRSSAVLGAVFLIHLAFVLTLFLAAPYGKFVHFVYRFAALENDKLEKINEPILGAA
jgi:citrate/tricarballylate utilization protein